LRFLLDLPLASLSGYKVKPGELVVDWYRLVSIGHSTMASHFSLEGGCHSWDFFRLFTLPESLSLNLSLGVLLWILGLAVLSLYTLIHGA